MSREKIKKRDTLGILAAALALFILFLGTRPFSTRGEGREALVAQAMVDSGNWLLGSGYGGVVPSKPPFMHWIISFCSLFSGEVNEWTARLPSALAAVFFAVVWFQFLSARVKRETALLSTLVLLTAGEWYRAAIVCRVDMILAVLLGLAFIWLYTWWERKLAGFPILAVIAICGATLTKGPVAIALPAVIFSIFLYLQGENPRRIIGKCLLVFLPALAGALLWYVAAYIERGPEFFNKFYYENIARLTSSQEDSPHRHNAIYLLGTIVLGFLPWTLLLIPSLVPLIRWVRLGWRGWRDWFRALGPFEQFSFLATVIFILFFSLPSGKRSVYLLPVYPMLAYGIGALLVSQHYHERLFSRIVVRSLTGILAVASIFALVFSTFLYNVGPGSSAGMEGESVIVQNLLAGLVAGGAQTTTLLLYLLVSLIIVGALWTHGLLKRSVDFGVYLILIYVCASGSVLTYVSEQMSGKRFAAEIGKNVPSDAKLFSFEQEYYGLSFYLHREIKRLTENPELNSYVFVSDDKLDELRGILGDKQRLVTKAQSRNSIDKLGAPVALVQIVPQ